MNEQDQPSQWDQLTTGRPINDCANDMLTDDLTAVISKYGPFSTPSESEDVIMLDVDQISEEVETECTVVEATAASPDTASSDADTAPIALPATPAEQEAQDAFVLLFPDGYSLIETSGDNLQCGFYATINSLTDLKKRDPRVPVPTLEQLQQVYNSDEFQAMMMPFLPSGDTANTDEYRIDQIAAVVDWWARTNHSVSLRLGWILSNTPPMLTPSRPLVNGTPVIRFFIHNNATNLHQEHGNHFSGMARRGD